MTGTGPTVVLQGGLTSRKLDVERLGYVELFTDAYQVVNVDSLGHGDSDTPRVTPACTAGDSVLATSQR